MRSYEALYIIRPDLEAEQIEAVVNKFTNLVEKNGGEIIQVDKWGKKRLAYEVRKYREGYYVLMQFRGTPAIAQELERVFKITDEVIRYLIARLEEKAS
ncbi:SSU ribosomal protein S6P [Thermanaeromonas toyohensis ToBE]|uniref:Small ribosomal subunit protein bS6 n=1 Tax=Thermanaeromonas toyohensis ToBE TaxID=698762 RepID=A0A1W1W3T4_9FIRM|nr:30S ribosomal protein S6 [Thermanaeromonas toyohensis]SMC00031.1 SSU ribosomal protein S6P [Thermanaeromonas toyohensis ToBE]